MSDWNHWADAIMATMILEGVSNLSDAYSAFIQRYAESVNLPIVHPASELDTISQIVDRFESILEGFK